MQKTKPSTGQGEKGGLDPKRGLDKRDPNEHETEPGNSPEQRETLEGVAKRTPTEVEDEANSSRSSDGEEVEADADSNWLL